VGRTKLRSSAGALLPALLPAGAILATEILIGFGDVGDVHGGTVVHDFSSGTQRDHAEEHDFRELGGV